MSEILDSRGRTEAEAIAQFRAANYPKPSLTADMVALARNADGEISVLMIRRGGHPYLGCLALPGGFAEQQETIEQTAQREMEEETGVTGLTPKLIGVYSRPGRDPRGWVVSAVYGTVVDASRIHDEAADDAASVGWYRIGRDGDGALTLTGPEGTVSASGLAFDHAEILEDAVRALIG